MWKKRHWTEAKAGKLSHLKALGVESGSVPCLGLRSQGGLSCRPGVQDGSRCVLPLQTP